VGINKERYTNHCDSRPSFHRFFLAAALECNIFSIFSQFQFNLYFLLILIISCFPSLITLTYYIFIVSKIILTSYKHSRTYLLACIILKHSLAILKEAVVKDSFCFKLPIRLDTVSKGRFHIWSRWTARGGHTCNSLDEFR